MKNAWLAIAAFALVAAAVFDVACGLTPTLALEVFAPSHFFFPKGGERENPRIANVGGNDGFGNFRVFSGTHTGVTHMTDCHGFTTSPSTTPSSVVWRPSPVVTGEITMVALVEIGRNVKPPRQPYVACTATSDPRVCSRGGTEFVGENLHMAQARRGSGSA